MIAARSSQLLLLALGFFMYISTVQAAGKIYNQSPWTLKYTTNPSPNNGCSSCCYFWNWNNASPRGQMCSCTQVNLGSKGSKTNADVDGFCYADRDYYYRGTWVKKGQWSKFADTQSVRCVSKGGVPRCCVTGDPESYGCCWGVAPGPNGIVC
ncbi:hypothetical protein H2201_005562 [Coniosporium apollinis]|uniref:Secreted protein n=2 Tax=Coniosporium TaxID=2810619 RepID=A0ABQ9NRL2_9PEZI|nr:hypothetical protein H2199_002996 [Cladosporium sp. JES 115]KAJ9663601.1 hypothetical protein H2201_005562 [Coniosporium apollinis]